MGLATNKHCPSGDASVNKLKYEYTLKGVMDIEQYISVIESMEHAAHLDNKPRE
jgi:hypothetical protein